MFMKVPVLLTPMELRSSVSSKLGNCTMGRLYFYAHHCPENILCSAWAMKYTSEAKRMMERR